MSAVQVGVCVAAAFTTSIDYIPLDFSPPCLLRAADGLARTCLQYMC